MRKLLPAVAALALSACGPSEPDPAPRVLSVVPEGEGIAPDAPGISVRFSEPVETSGVEDGRFVALAAEADAKPAATAAASATGIGPGVAVVPVRVTLTDGGREAALAPEGPLQALGAYAVVVGTGIRSKTGRAVLDPSGRKRAFATTFRTGPMPDRTLPAARWILPPHGPVPLNLKEIRVGFSEVVSGSLSVNGVAGRPRAITADVLAFVLDGPLRAGPLAPVFDAVRDGGGNRPSPLPGVEVASCRDELAPVVDPACVRVLPADTTLTLAAEASELTRLGVEVSVERLGEACGALPDLPGSLVAWGDVAPCPGHDPCGPSTRCPAAAVVPGLCPGRAGEGAGPGRGPGREPGRARSLDAGHDGLPRAPPGDHRGPRRRRDAPGRGEFVELANLGSGDADLRGWKLAKRSAAGAVSRCTLEPRNGALPPGGHALVVGGSWDGRYPVPAGVPLFLCGATSLAGGLADDRAPALALESPSGEVVSGFGWAAPSLRCTARSVERILPGGEDATSNLACARSAPGTPGACNGNTPADGCPRSPF